MRRDAPNPFGTSLIDLLVGALAMVALLWTMNAGNSGYSGTGPEEEASAMALVEQYGTVHIFGLKLARPGEWSCDFGLDWTRRKSIPKGCSGENGVSPPSASDGVLEFPQDPTQPSKTTKVIWRLDRPPGTTDFMVSLVVTVEGLVARDLVAEIGILPCCDDSEPHYLRAMSLSGSGQEEWVAFWHEALKLRSVLEDPPLTDNWITSFRERIDDGTISPQWVLFDAEGQSCSILQRPSNGNLPKLKIVFEAEGDVRFERPPPPSSGTGHVSLASRYQALVAAYAAATP